MIMRLQQDDNNVDGENAIDIDRYMHINIHKYLYVYTYLPNNSSY